ncbi:MAG: hypothetical protein HYV63_15185 [Candidatus Schekmanbacteria bacterium]|nr:hypothetical protein [Candidatus Schekmanbacteria bacterium]
MRKLASGLLLQLAIGMVCVAACAGESNSRPPGDAAAAVVGLAGMEAWDSLPEAEKNRVLTEIQSFFLHQSVGGDLEDGAEAVGFKFEWADSGATNLSPGLNGGLFSSSNGDPEGKIAEFRTMALANASTLAVAIMKFGYADIADDKIAAAQTSYAAAVAEIRAAGVHVLHITPPLVYAAPEENAPKMTMRTWMLTAFSGDVVFDLEDVESTDSASGTRCERGGYWEICDSVRSTESCPSKNQGIDSPSGQGHICFDPHAQRFAKAFLYAIYLAGGGAPPATVPSGSASSLVLLSTAALVLIAMLSRRRRGSRVPR